MHDRATLVATVLLCVAALLSATCGDVTPQANVETVRCSSNTHTLSGNENLRDPLQVECGSGSDVRWLGDYRYVRCLSDVERLESDISQVFLEGVGGDVLLALVMRTDVNVYRLRILHSPVTDDEIRTVGTMPVLAHVEIRDCPKLTFKGLACFLGAPCLRSISVSCAQITAAEHHQLTALFGTTQEGFTRYKVR